MAGNTLRYNYNNNPDQNVTEQLPFVKLVFDYNHQSKSKELKVIDYSNQRVQSSNQNKRKIDNQYDSSDGGHLSIKHIKIENDLNVNYEIPFFNRDIKFQTFIKPDPDNKHCIRPINLQGYNYGKEIKKQSVYDIRTGKLYELGLLIFILHLEEKKFDIGREVLLGDKFDDIVIRTNNQQNKTNFILSYRLSL